MEKPPINIKHNLTRGVMKTLKSKLTRAKTHKFKPGADFRDLGQTEFEYSHTSACGYVRAIATNDDKLVTCKHCKNKLTG